PELILRLEVGNRKHVFRQVANHQLDVAIGGRPPPGGELVGKAFMENPIMLITAPDDPLAHRRAVPVAELGERPWLLRERGSGTRMMTDEFLAHHELNPEMLTLGSNGAIKQAARAGLGVSFQSRATTALELAHGILGTVSVREPLPRRQWFALWPAKGPMLEHVEDFLDFVLSKAAKEHIERFWRVGEVGGQQRAGADGASKPKPRRARAQ
ncbi:MAG: LysR substrate-binding domain-containing protein, partial [Actinomycetota bacterium]|nr:LysR substrate-binding domain-containing protein [Actinomycetota bacterium]